MEKKDKISIIGIGNLLMSDEGFGVHAIRFLEKNFELPDNVKLIDCGTAGIYMAPIFEESDFVIVIDCADIKGYEAGSLLLLEYKDMNSKQIQSSMSPHQLGVLEILEICKLRDKLPSKIYFYLVIPDKIEPGIELSETLLPKIKEVCNNILTQLEEMGYSVKNA